MKRVITLILTVNTLIQAGCGVFEIIADRLGKKIAPEVGSLASKSILGAKSGIQNVINSAVGHYKDFITSDLGLPLPIVQDIQSSGFDSDNIQFQEVLYPQMNCLEPTFNFEFLKQITITINLGVWGDVQLEFTISQLSFSVSPILNQNFQPQPITVQNFNADISQIDGAVINNSGVSISLDQESIKQWLRSQLQSSINSLLANIKCQANIKGEVDNCTGI
ncbi:hypothetical protein A3F66_01550 [candidate division TM6 bacterium RIFCSPHIGHO2_12_FULL_32_22]|nr:MAG: hypothetical protein A3F66_01550 [candidate division TM6 bacterium RIFCSPHIGHO2_12_FULL_32_22]